MRKLVEERRPVLSGMYITPRFLTCKKTDVFPSVEDTIFSTVLVPGRWWIRRRWSRTVIYLYGVLYNIVKLLCTAFSTTSLTINYPGLCTKVCIAYSKCSSTSLNALQIFEHITKVLAEDISLPLYRFKTVCLQWNHFKQHNPFLYSTPQIWPYDPSGSGHRACPQGRRGMEGSTVGVKLEDVFHEGWLVKPCGKTQVAKSLRCGGQGEEFTPLHLEGWGKG